MIQLQCPQCGKKLQVDDKYAGKSGNCLHCQQPIRVPMDVDPLIPVAGLHTQSMPPPIEYVAKKKQRAQGISIRNPVTHGFGFGCGLILLFLTIFVVMPIVGLVLLAIIGVAAQ